MERGFVYKTVPRKTGEVLENLAGLLSSTAVAKSLDP
jgi:hypothetical protein